MSLEEAHTKFYQPMKLPKLKRRIAISKISTDLAKTEEYMSTKPCIIPNDDGPNIECTGSVSMSETSLSLKVPKHTTGDTPANEKTKSGAIPIIVLSPHHENVAYKDHSQLSSEKNEDNEKAALLFRTAAEKKTPQFPVVLHKILCNPESRDVISWLPHGRSWRIVDPNTLERKIIPKYFRHSKYSSFLRQVNGWGFCRVSDGPDLDSYYHEQFLRGLPQICLKMTRVGKRLVRPSTGCKSPNFYKISEKFPLPEYSETLISELSCELQDNKNCEVVQDYEDDGFVSPSDEQTSFSQFVADSTDHEPEHVGGPKDALESPGKSSQGSSVEAQGLPSNFMRSYLSRGGAQLLDPNYGNTATSPSIPIANLPIIHRPSNDSTPSASVPSDSSQVQSNSNINNLLGEIEGLRTQVIQNELHHCLDSVPHLLLQIAAQNSLENQLFNHSQQSNLPLLALENALRMSNQHRVPPQSDTTSLNEELQQLRQALAQSQKHNHLLAMHLAAVNSDP